MEWAKVREFCTEGVSQREIAGRLGINRRTVARLAAASEPPRYHREPAGSALDPLEPLTREVLAEWPRIRAPRMTQILWAHGNEGSDRVVRRRLAELRPPVMRAAQRTGYAPGQVAPGQLGRDGEPAAHPGARAADLRPGDDAALLGRPNRPLLVRHDGGFVPGRARTRLRLPRRRAGRMRLRQPARGCRPARRRADPLGEPLHPPARPLRLLGPRLHAGEPAREGLGGVGGALPEDGLLAGAADRRPCRSGCPVRRLA
jgi:hypothetical protein